MAICFRIFVKVLFFKFLLFGFFKMIVKNQRATFAIALKFQNDNIKYSLKGCCKNSFKQIFVTGE